MSEVLFSCERFLSLDDDKLVRYAEPFVTTQADSVPKSAYELLVSKLDDLGDIHTVYALEICMRIDPQDVVGHVVRFLSHPSSSVCCTACRLIETLPPRSVSADLVRRIAETPIVDLFTSHFRSGERVRVGTNEEFIRVLVARFRS
jgi:hypothetical protein